MGERVRVDGVNEYILEREKDLDDTGLGSDTESPDEDDQVLLEEAADEIAKEYDTTVLTKDVLKSLAQSKLSMRSR